MGCSNRAERHADDGFTLVEMAIVVLVLGIIISIAAVNYSNISNGININGATKQIEAALNRARTAARQENVKYQVVLYMDSSADHPNSYEFLHDVYAIATGWTMTPVNGSVSGEAVASSGGHTYILMTNGVKITRCTEIAGNKVSITFAPSGTTMSISGSDVPTVPNPPVTSETVTLEIGSGDKTGSVSIDGMGKITVD